MGSNIAAIIEYSAVVVGRDVEGVAAIYANGLGTYTDPLTGQPVPAAPETPTQEYEHWSDLPAAPTGWVPFSQDGDIQVTWDVPMRLYLLTTDYQELRKKAMPFYDRYLGAFVRDRDLGGLANLNVLGTSFVLGMDPPMDPSKTRWAWLEIHLAVSEQVSY